MNIEGRTRAEMADRDVVFEAMSDEDMLLISDFVSGALSATRRHEVEQRLVSDPAFRQRADPVLWLHAATTRGGAQWLTEERLHERWRRFRAEVGLPYLPDPVLDNDWRKGRVEAERHERARRRITRLVGVGIALVIAVTSAALAWGPGLLARIRQPRPPGAIAGSLTPALTAGDTTVTFGPASVRVGRTRFRVDAQGDSLATIEGIEGTVVVRNRADANDSLVVHPGERVRVRSGGPPFRLPR